MYCCYRSDYSLVEGFGDNEYMSSYMERYQYKDDEAEGNYNDTLQQLWFGKLLL